MKNDKEIQKLQGIWQRPGISKRWMRDEITLEELRQEFGCKYPYKKLSEMMQADWVDTTAINTAFFSAVKGLFPEAIHYVATDNMDIFIDYVNKNPRFKSNVSEVFNSFEYGCLKDDTPGLFEAILKKLNKNSFEDSLLFDNDNSSCQ